MTIDGLLFLAFVIVALAAGFWIGKMHEREAWNKLIEEGKISKPF